MLQEITNSRDVLSSSQAELVDLLTAQGARQQQLFAWARQVRQKYWGDEVVLRGVIEVSSYCQKNCSYCAMRCANRQLARYRLSAEQVFSVAAEIHRAGISTIFLQSGQDPEYDPVLEEVIPEVRRELGAEALLCVGERPRGAFERFAELGASGYILKFETSDAQLYRQVAHASLERRLQCLRWIRAAGLRLGTGNIVGLPQQTRESLADDIRFAASLQPNYVSCSPFIPNEHTPYETCPPGDLNLTLNIIALWRIALPRCLSPAVSALEKLQPHGQALGLSAGANVLTINFTPIAYRNQYAIYSQQRFVVSMNHALNTIREAGLRAQVLATAPEASQPAP